jgi:peptidoglycan/xylan/chitin deacetylase (PgdA/CDA1 family)
MIPVKQIVKVPVRAALDRVPLAVWQRVFPRELVSLDYHVVSDERLAHIYYPYKSTRQFRADLEYLGDRYGFLGYDDLDRDALGDRASRQNRVLLTFDDGFAQCFDVIRPILHEHGAGAVFFVPVGFLGDREVFFETKVALCIEAVKRMDPDQVGALGGWAGAREPTDRARRVAALRWSYTRLDSPVSAGQKALILRLLAFEQCDGPELDRACEAHGVDVAGYIRRAPVFMSAEQVRRLAAEGFTVGAHGRSHVKLQGLGPEALEREIVESCAVVRDLTGQARVPFAFPYNGSGLDSAFLAGLRAWHDFIGLYFDTGGLRRNAPFIIDRLLADSPVRFTADGTNLPYLFQQAWSRPPAWRRPERRPKAATTHP